MFILLLRKELKVFFSSKGNLAFMILLPILLVTIMSFSLKSYMDADYGTFEDGRLYYYLAEPAAATLGKFESIATEIGNATGAQIEQVFDYGAAMAEVESSGAYGVITLTGESMEYCRSPFNEPEGGKIVRGMVEQLSTSVATSFGETVKTITLQTAGGNSKVYFTYSGLAFAILFMALLIAHSVYDERELKTIQRIRLSKAGISQMFVSKIATGIACGSVQVLVVFLFSTFALGVQWGALLPMMLLVLLFLILYSSVFGTVLGMVSKSKSMCQSTVMMITMLCGYLGGAITPLYLLENNAWGFVVKVSPLYWANRALSSLQSGILNKTTYYSIAVLLGISIVILGLYFISTRKPKATKRGAA